MSPEDLSTHNVTLFAKKVFANTIKGLEMRSFWIQGDPKSNDVQPPKRKTGTDLAETQWGGHVQSGADWSSIKTKANYAWSHQKLIEAGEDCSQICQG